MDLQSPGLFYIQTLDGKCHWEGQLKHHILGLKQALNSTPACSPDRHAQSAAVFAVQASSCPIGLLHICSASRSAMPSSICSSDAAGRTLSIKHLYKWHLTFGYKNYCAPSQLKSNSNEKSSEARLISISTVQAVHRKANHAMPNPGAYEHSVISKTEKTLFQKGTEITFYLHSAHPGRAQQLQDEQY